MKIHANMYAHKSMSIEDRLRLMDLKEKHKECLTMPKKILIALPPAMLEQIDQIALVEHRNRSDLVRESLRKYINEFKKEQNYLFSPRPEQVDKIV
jgi:predicted DNA-binding protein